jgi:hypothetical protein
MSQPTNMPRPVPASVPLRFGPAISRTAGSESYEKPRAAPVRPQQRHSATQHQGVVWEFWVKSLLRGGDQLTGFGDFGKMYAHLDSIPYSTAF